MKSRNSRLEACKRVLRFALPLIASVWLAGCAGIGDSAVSGAFVDPSKYELYDCKQLETERKALETRSDQLQRLIDKANTGVAGSVVGEAVYRNDYINARASLKLVNEAWERGKCVASPTPPPATPAAPKPAARTAR